MDDKTIARKYKELTYIVQRNDIDIPTLKDPKDEIELLTFTTTLWLIKTFIEYGVADLIECNTRKIAMNASYAGEAAYTRTLFLTVKTTEELNNATRIGGIVHNMVNSQFNLGMLRGSRDIMGKFETITNMLPLIFNWYRSNEGHFFWVRKNASLAIRLRQMLRSNTYKTLIPSLITDIVKDMSMITEYYHTHRK